MPVKTHPDRSPSGRVVLIVGAMATAGVILIVGWASRHSQAGQLEQMAERKRIATVALVVPRLVTPASLQLPGRIEAWSRAPLYARVSGYLKQWDRDIGSRVKAGELLAQIDAPDLDQQLRQARAALATARSEMSLAGTTAKRWEQLRESEAVSLQEVEERRGDLATKRSQVNEAQANVDRLQALQGYTRIVAPFDGVVTARNTDVGALINIGMTVGSELFVVSDVSRLRVYVSVPQRQLAWIKVGTRATLSVPERPGQTFDATVRSLAQAVDVETGAMRVQLSVENQRGDLLPGSFASVLFEGTPAPTALSRDYGTYLEFADGVRQSDHVIANPPDGLSSGDKVRIMRAEITASE